MKKLAGKDLIIFDLDGTLAESKQVVDAEMVGLLGRLLEQKKMAVISGGSFAQFEKQFLPGLEELEKIKETEVEGGKDHQFNPKLTMYVQRQSDSKKNISLDAHQKLSPAPPYYSFLFSNLFLLPTTGSTLYVFKKNNWVKKYSHDLSVAEKEKIYAAFKEAVEKSGEKMPTETYGPASEDRGGQRDNGAATRQPAHERLMP